jgi:hypothetical protein
MSASFRVTYQPEIDKTLMDPGVITREIRLTFDQWIGILLAGVAIFGDGINYHLAIAVPETFHVHPDWEAYIIPIVPTNRAIFQIVKGQRRYTALLTGPTNVMEIQFDSSVSQAPQAPQNHPNQTQVSWDVLQGVINTYGWFGLDYHEYVRELIDWTTQTKLRLP